MGEFLWKFPNRGLKKKWWPKTPKRNETVVDDFQGCLYQIPDGILLAHRPMGSEWPWCLQWRKPKGYLHEVMMSRTPQPPAHHHLTVRWLSDWILRVFLKRHPAAWSGRTVNLKACVNRWRRGLGKPSGRGEKCCSAKLGNRTESLLILQTSTTIPGVFRYYTRGPNLLWTGTFFEA